MDAPFTVRAFTVFDMFTAPGSTTFGSSDLNAIRAYIDDHKALGFNTLTLGWGVPIDPATGARVSGFAMAGVHEASFDELIQIANYAKSAGLDVILKPQAQSALPTGTNGNLPDNINANSITTYKGFSVTTFLHDWSAFMAQAATLAQQIGAVELVVGTENSGFDTAAYREGWKDIIAAARSHYTGQLSYDALYPLKQEIGVDKVGFWDLLDIIGVSAYYPLTSKSNPTYDDVLAGWFDNSIYPNNTGAKLDVVAALKALSTQYGKPVQFEEFGIQSFHGVLADPSGGGPVNKVADWQQQAWAYQSMIDAFSKNNSSGWFRGFSSVGMSQVPGEEDPRFAGYLSASGSTSFDVRGKDAATLLAAAFGATDHLAFGAMSFTGSVLDDHIALYGTATGGVAHRQVDTYPVDLHFSLSGALIDGKAPTVHLFANGTDYGAFTIDPVPSDFIDQAGVRWTRGSEISISLPAATQLANLRVVVDGGSSGKVFIGAATANLVPLTNITYDGATMTIDATPWNAQLSAPANGTASQPLHVDGGAGIDTTVMLGQQNQYKVASSGSTVTLTEESGLGQNAILQNVERVQFSDGAYAFDVNGNAGEAYRLYQAAFDRVPDPAGLGYWIAALDEGASLLSVAHAFSTSAEFLAKFGAAPSDSAFLSLLYQNILHRTPDPAGYDYWLGVLKANPQNASIRDVLLVNFSESAENNAGVATIIGNGMKYIPWVSHLI